MQVGIFPSISHSSDFAEEKLSSNLSLWGTWAARYWSYRSKVHHRLLVLPPPLGDLPTREIIPGLSEQAAVEGLDCILCCFYVMVLIGSVGSQAGQEDRSRFPQNGYHGGGGRSQSYRTDSYVEGRSNGMARPDSYYHMNDNAGPPNGPGYYNPSRARYPRTASEPHFNNGQGVYPGPGNQHSYETVTTASGSGSSPDTMGYSTDPSSENSSVDRYGPPQQKEPMDNYGFNGFGGNAPIQPPGYNINEQQQYYGSNGTQQQSYGQPPQVPRKEHPESRVPIKLGAGENGGSPSPGEKRKSWFGKRFSKNS